MPSKEQQESLGIEEGRTLDAEDLGLKSLLFPETVIYGSLVRPFPYY